MPIDATLLAFATLLLWSFLAFFGARLNHVPPLLLVGVALSVSGTLGMVRWRQWRVPPKTMLVGVGGIFGYHFLYFTAFRYAPVVEANLINYLWPLLIVLLSPLFLRGYHLRSHHRLGALAGFAGAALIVSGGALRLDLAHLAGYLCAGGAALVWASYSLLTRRLPPFSTAAVGAFCLFSGLLSLVAYFIQTGSSAVQANLTLTDGLLLILVGAGPMGAAFFTWDAALKRGDPRIIGSLAYLTPLTSTLILVVLGGRALTWVSVLAMLLIVAGAAVGSLDLLRFPRADSVAEAARVENRT